MSFEVVMLTPIVKRKILIKEIFGFIKNHKSYGSLNFLSSEYFIHIFPMFGVPRPRERGNWWGKNCFAPFYAWLLFSREEKWFIFSCPHQKRENMNTPNLETRKWGLREKIDVYSMFFPENIETITRIPCVVIALWEFSQHFRRNASTLSRPGTNDPIHKNTERTTQLLCSLGARLTSARALLAIFPNTGSEEYGHVPWCIFFFFSGEIL